MVITTQIGRPELKMFKVLNCNVLEKRCVELNRKKIAIGTPGRLSGLRVPTLDFS